MLNQTNPFKGIRQLYGTQSVKGRFSDTNYVIDSVDVNKIYSDTIISPSKLVQKLETNQIYEFTGSKKLIVEDTTSEVVLFDGASQSNVFAKAIGGDLSNYAVDLYSLEFYGCGKDSANYNQITFRYRVSPGFPGTSGTFSGTTNPCKSYVVTRQSFDTVSYRSYGNLAQISIKVENMNLPVGVPVEEDYIYYIVYKIRITPLA